MLNQFIYFFKEKNLQQNHFIVATSGGVDSVVLCELCYQAKFSFSIAHCNFKLRGAESDTDEAFVRSLAEKYRVQMFVETFATEAFATEKKYLYKKQPGFCVIIGSKF